MTRESLFYTLGKYKFNYSIEIQETKGIIIMKKKIVLVFVVLFLIIFVNGGYLENIYAASTQPNSSMVSNDNATSTAITAKGYANLLVYIRFADEAEFVPKIHNAVK